MGIEVDPTLGPVEQHEEEGSATADLPRVQLPAGGPAPAPEAEPEVDGAPRPPSRWRRRLRLLAKIALIGAAASVVLGVAGYFWISRDLPSLDSLQDYRPLESTRVYAADGSLMAEYFVERRTVVPMTDLPPVLIQALVSAEDKEFYEHVGFNPLAILRAAVTNVLRGRKAHGASTLTQQTAKTFFLSPEKKLTRKAKELILSLRMEKSLSKDEILWLYLNQIYFGHRRYGVEEASLFYFGHGVRDVTLGEAAMLAGLPQSPERLSPRRNMEAAKARQAYVLRRMAANGYITKALAESEIQKPLVLAPAPATRPGAYYALEVKRHLVEVYGDTVVNTAGLRVYTAMDARLQVAAEAAVRKGLRAIDKREGWRGPFLRLAPEQIASLHEGVMERLAKKAEPFAWDLAKLAELPAEAKALLDEMKAKAAAAGMQDAHVTQVQDPDPKKIRLHKLELDAELIAPVVKVEARGADVDLGSAIAWMPFDSMRWARPFDVRKWTPEPKGAADVVARGDVVRVRVVKVGKPVPGTPGVTGCEVALEQEPAAEAALAAIDLKTRDVVALVGGYDALRSAFNRATQAKRQPGSSFKAFAWAAAIDSGKYTPLTTVLDAPEMHRDPWTGKVWEPKNYEREGFDGPMTLRKAIAESKNTVAVKLTVELGLDKVAAMARAAGVESPIPESLTAVLGSGEVGPMELTNAYATLGAQGRRGKPVLVKRVFSRQGERLEENGPVMTQAIRPEVAFVTADMLRAVVEDPDGTAHGLAAPLGRPVAGKTGTASESRDAWFVGMTPDLAAGVWVGFDDHEPLGQKETGGRAAGPIWLDFMKAAVEVRAREEFVAPPGVVKVRIDPRTGERASDDSPYYEDDYFVAGTEPAETARSGASTEQFFLGGPGGP